MTIPELDKEYKLLTKINDHTGAVKLIVDRFGTFDDKFQMDIISAAHNRRGHITQREIETRSYLENKWLPFFKYTLKYNHS